MPDARKPGNLPKPLFQEPPDDLGDREWEPGALLVSLLAHLIRAAPTGPPKRWLFAQVGGSTVARPHSAALRLPPAGTPPLAAGLHPRTRAHRCAIRASAPAVSPIDHPNDEAGEISMRRAGRGHQQRRDKVAANLAKRAGA